MKIINIFKNISNRIAELKKNRSYKSLQNFKNGSPIKITNIPNGFRGLIVITSSNSSLWAIYGIITTSSGVVGTHFLCGESQSFTLTAGTNEVTIESASTSNAYTGIIGSDTAKIISVVGGVVKGLLLLLCRKVVAA